jgi:hypothetical protein
MLMSPEIANRAAQGCLKSVTIQPFCSPCQPAMRLPPILGKNEMVNPNSVFDSGRRDDEWLDR